MLTAVRERWEDEGHGKTLTVFYLPLLLRKASPIHEAVGDFRDGREGQNGNRNTWEETCAIFWF